MSLPPSPVTVSPLALPMDEDLSEWIGYISDDTDSSLLVDLTSPPAAGTSTRRARRSAPVAAAAAAAGLAAATGTLTQSKPRPSTGKLWIQCATCDRTFEQHELEVHSVTCFEELMRQHQQEQQQAAASTRACAAHAHSNGSPSTPACGASSSSTTKLMADGYAGSRSLPVLLSPPTSPPEPGPLRPTSDSPPILPPMHAAASASPPAIKREHDASRMSSRSMLSPAVHLAPPPVPPASATASASAFSSSRAYERQKGAEADSGSDDFDFTSPAVPYRYATSSSAAAAAAAVGQPLTSHQAGQKRRRVESTHELMSPTATASESADVSEFETTMQKCIGIVQQAQAACGAAGPSPAASHTLAASASDAESASARLASTHTLLSSLSDLHRTLNSCFLLFHARLSELVLSLRRERDAQAEEFLCERLRLEEAVRGNVLEREEQMSAIRVEELLRRDKEDEAHRREKERLGEEYSRERIRLDQEKAAEIESLKQKAASVAQQMEQMSSNSQALMEGEAKAIETGEGELKRIVLLPSDTFGGHTSAEFHFRLAESQFLRMTGGAGGGYHVSKIEYILNPPLLKRYHDFKAALLKKGEKVEERLTFHGTTVASMEKIIVEGFRIGGVDTPILAGAALGTGVYSSEDPSFAMKYIKDGRKCLLFARVCPSSDSVIARGHHGVIQQLVTKSRDQILPTYIVHYEAGVRRHDAPPGASRVGRKRRSAGFPFGAAPPAPPVSFAPPALPSSYPFAPPSPASANYPFPPSAAAVRGAASLAAGGTFFPAAAAAPPGPPSPPRTRARARRSSLQPLALPPPIPPHPPAAAAAVPQPAPRLMATAPQARGVWPASLPVPSWLSSAAAAGAGVPPPAVASASAAPLAAAARSAMPLPAAAAAAAPPGAGPPAGPFDAGLEEALRRSLMEARRR